MCFPFKHGILNTIANMSLMTTGPKLAAMDGFSSEAWLNWYPFPARLSVCTLGVRRLGPWNSRNFRLVKFRSNNPASSQHTLLQGKDWHQVDGVFILVSLFTTSFVLKGLAIFTEGLQWVVLQQLGKWYPLEISTNPWLLTVNKKTRVV